MRLIQVFDPALCCSSGVCGAEVDQNLVTFAGDAEWIKQQGGSLYRFNLAQQPLVMPSRPNALRMLLERKMADIGCQPHIAMEIDGVPAILDLVSEGVGYAVLPGHAVQASAHPGHYLLHPITEPRVIGQVYLVTSARRASTLTQQAMVELIREQVAQLAPQGIQTAVAADGDL